ncbi:MULTISPECIES: MbcA/ParS/Xre antitoxin family protein [Acidobacterium]|nr:MULTISPECIES: MbcA/ParS/Xre antitoxin family protein [Acidobacterium]
MVSSTVQQVPGYPMETLPNLSDPSERARLSRSAIDGFFSIVQLWGLPVEIAAQLLGGVPRSTLYRLKSSAGTRTIDQLTRISYIIGIYKALHILLPKPLADTWMTRPNDHSLFGGRTPLEYVLQHGMPGLHQVRSLLDSSIV